MNIQELAEILEEVNRTQREILEAVRQIAEIHARRVEDEQEAFSWPRDAA